MDDAHAGRTASCRKCNRKFVIEPVPAEAPAPNQAESAPGQAAANPVTLGEPTSVSQKAPATPQAALTGPIATSLC